MSKVFSRSLLAITGAFGMMLGLSSCNHIIRRPTLYGGPPMEYRTIESDSLDNGSAESLSRAIKEKTITSREE
ncbi:MAG: hypothetical protein IJM81_06405 [Prevotella sp.]|nr:hypothetical protein [Prevotella sp.]